MVFCDLRVEPAPPSARALLQSGLFKRTSALSWRLRSSTPKLSIASPVAPPPKLLGITIGAAGLSLDVVAFGAG